MKEIELPDGSIGEFPDEMSDQDIERVLVQQFSPRQQYEPSRTQSGVAGAADIATFGLATNPAVQAGLGSLMGRGDYEQLKQEYAAKKQSLEQSPYYTAGQVVGGVASGIGAAKMAPKALTGMVEYAGTRGFLPSIAAGGGLGGISGGLYGAGSTVGTGQDVGEAVKTSAAYGAGGGVGGSAFARMVGPLTQKAMSWANKAKTKPISVPQTSKDVLSTTRELAQKQTELPQVTGQGAAYSKVENILKKDFGKDYDVALEAYKKGDISLAELYGKRTTSLAQGAAQYPSGRAKALEYFEPKAQGSYDRVLASIGKNISGVDNYYTTIDDILFKGRAKASPLYKQSENILIDDKSIVSIPEIQDALNKAYKEYPTELKDFSPDSIKALDYAKRVLDDQIEEATRAGRNNFVRSRTDIKNILLNEMDNASPIYKEARKKAGDYLSIKSAMEKGKDALKQDSEILQKEFKLLNDAEKEAFRIGIGKSIRDKIGGYKTPRDPYKEILGSPEMKKKLSSVLSPSQYKNLENDLMAESWLFDQRNTVLKNSATAEKLEAKNLIGDGIQSINNIADIPKKTMIQGLQKFFDGLDDAQAQKISEILYETDPKEKVKILKRLGKSGEFDARTANKVKQYYFKVSEYFDSGVPPLNKTSGSIGGGATTAGISNQSEQQ